MRRQIGAHHTVAHAPTGHGVSLRKTVEQNRALLHSVDRHDGVVFAVENQAAINLVAQHRNVAIANRPRDGINVFFLEYAASRVLRRIQNDQFRPIIDQSGEFIDVEPEIQLLSQPDRHSFRADVIDHRLVNRKPRIWIDDLIALFGERQDSEKNNWLTARNNDHFLGCNVYAPRFAYVLRYDLAQFHQSCRRPVMCETFVQRITSGVYDVARRVEIGLPDLEMNDAAALRFKRFRFYQHFKRRLSPEPCHAFGEAKFLVCGLVHNSESSSSRRFSQLSTINTQLWHARSPGLRLALRDLATGRVRPTGGLSRPASRVYSLAF